MFGLTWPLWKRLVAECEQLGFRGVFRSDHFTLPLPVDLDSLESLVSLTYLADHTNRVHFGPLVAPLSFRDPVMLARQGAGPGRPQRRTNDPGSRRRVDGARARDVRLRPGRCADSHCAARRGT